MNPLRRRTHELNWTCQRGDGQCRDHAPLRRLAQPLQRAALPETLALDGPRPLCIAQVPGQVILHLVAHPLARGRELTDPVLAARPWGVLSPYSGMGQTN